MGKSKSQKLQGDSVMARVLHFCEFYFSTVKMGKKSPSSFGGGRGKGTILKHHNILFLARFALRRSDLTRA